MKSSKNKTHKAIYFTLCPLLFLIFIFIALFPTLLSTDFGKTFLTNRVKELRIDQLHLSWFGPQTIQGVQYRTKEINFSIHSFTTESSLFRIAFQKGDMGQTTLASPHLFLSLPSEKSKPKSEKKKTSKSKEKPKCSKPIWKNLSATLTLTDGKVEVQKNGGKPFSIDEIYLHLVLPQKKSTLSLTTHGITKQNTHIGDFSISGEIGEKLYEGVAQVNNFPMGGIDQLIGFFEPSLQGILTEAIGETLNVSLEAKLPSSVLQIRSNHFNADFSGEYREGNFSLTHPGSLVWTIHPSVSHLILAKLDLPLHSEEMILRAHLDAFLLPKMNWSVVKAKGDISLEEGAQSLEKLFISFDTTQDNSKQLLASVSLPFLDVPSFELTLQNGGQFIVASELYLKPDVLGEPIKLNGKGTLEVKKKDLIIDPLEINISSHQLKSQLVGVFRDHSLILKKGVTIDLVLEPNQINPYLSSLPTLSTPTPLQLTINPTTLSFKNLEVKGKGVIESLPFQVKSPYSPFSLEKINIDFCYGKKKRERLVIEADAVQSNKQRGSIHIQLEDPLFIHLQCKDLSSHIADSILQTEGQLSEIIGDTIQLNCELSPSHGEKELKCLVNSPYLDINGTFLLGSELKLKNPNHPLKIKWTMTESSVRAVEKWRHFSSSSITLKDVAKLKIQASSLTLPLDFNLSKAVFDTSIKINKFDFQEAGSAENIILSDFDLSFNKKSLEAPLEFTLQGKINYDALNETGHMRANGNLNLSNLSTSTHVSINKLPTVLLDHLAKITSNSKFIPSAFLGARINATLDADIQNKMGTLQMNIDASSCKATLASTISDGILGLTAPLKASLTITSQMKEALDKKGSIKISSVNKPITLSIQEKGFSIPINDVSLQSIKIQKGSIDFGQITSENTGNTSAVGSIFKMRGNNSVSLWFAPLDFKLSKGIMKIERTEILYNQAYQIALWGNLDFNQQYANMSLGLTAQSLKSALGIGKLGSSYVLEVPLRGPFGDIKVDKAAAATQIAFLIARTRATSAKAGVFGKVIGVIGELSHNQKNIPPEKPPFPWGDKKK